MGAQRRGGETLAGEPHGRRAGCRWRAQPRPPTHPHAPPPRAPPLLAPQCGRQMLRGVQNQRALAHLIHDDADMAAVLASRDPVSYCLFKVQYKERSFRGEK